MAGWVFPIRLRNGRQIAAQGKPGVESMMSVLPEDQAARYREVFSTCYKRIEDVLISGGGILARGEIIRLDPLVWALGNFVENQAKEAGLGKLINYQSAASQMLYSICDQHGLGQKTVDRNKAVSWRRFDTAYRRRKYHEAKV